MSKEHLDNKSSKKNAGFRATGKKEQLSSSRLESQQNDTVISLSKKKKWKKPKGKPKRPLSAYNLFFQHEREKIIASTAPRPQSVDMQLKKKRRRHRTTHGKISFADLAKTIGGKWKELDAASRAVFESRAKTEKMRYKRELDAWNSSQKGKNAEDDISQPEAATKFEPRPLSADFLTSGGHPSASFQPQSVYNPGDNRATFPGFSYHGSGSSQTADKVMSYSNVHHKPRSARTMEAVRSLSSLLSSGSSFKDPKFNATAHRECLEITRQTIEMAKATLSMPLPTLSSSVSAYSSTGKSLECSNEGVATSDDSFYKIGSSDPVQKCTESRPRDVARGNDLASPDIIDPSFWEKNEKQLTSPRDLLGVVSPRYSLGSFWDIDDSLTGADDFTRVL